MSALEMVIAIAMIALNIVWIVRLGIELGHPFLVPLGYIIILAIIGSKNENALLVVMIIVTVITIIGIIFRIVETNKKERLQNSLLEAIKSHDKEAVQKLITKDASVHSNVMEIAVKNSDKEMVSFLIENGVDVNCCKALVTAVKNGDKEMVSFLIEKGAKVNLGYDGKLPLDFAEGEELITLLKNHDAITKIEQDRLDIDFVNAVRHGDIAKVKCLIPQISNIDIVIPGHELEAEVVISNGVQKEALTPLMYAADYYDIEMVKLLVENGANVNAKDSHDHNALMYAVFRHDVIMIDFLASKGANVNAKSFNDSGSGITPLMVATDDGNIETVAALIKNGADVQAQTSRGNTALSVAKAHRFTEIENLLRKSGARY